jgi:hypothetical protein
MVELKAEDYPSETEIMSPKSCLCANTPLLYCTVQMMVGGVLSAQVSWFVPDRYKSVEPVGRGVISRITLPVYISVYPEKSD